MRQQTVTQMAKVLPDSLPLSGRQVRTLDSDRCSKPIGLGEVHDMIRHVSCFTNAVCTKLNRIQSRLGSFGYLGAKLHYIHVLGTKIFLALGGSLSRWWSRKGIGQGRIGCVHPGRFGWSRGPRRCISRRRAHRRRTSYGGNRRCSRRRRWRSNARRSCSHRGGRLGRWSRAGRHGCSPRSGWRRGRSFRCFRSSSRLVDPPFEILVVVERALVAKFGFHRTRSDCLFFLSAPPFSEP